MSLVLFLMFAISFPFVLYSEEVKSVVVNGIEMCPCPPGVKTSAVKPPPRSSRIVRNRSIPKVTDTNLNVTLEIVEPPVPPVAPVAPVAKEEKSAIDKLIELEIMRRLDDGKEARGKEVLPPPVDYSPLLMKQGELLERQNRLLEEQNEIAKRQAASLGKANLLHGANVLVNAADLVVDYLSYRRLGRINGRLISGGSLSDSAAAGVQIIQKVNVEGGGSQANGGSVALPGRPKGGH